MDFAKYLKESEEQLLKLEQQKLNIEQQMRAWIKLVEGLRVLVEQKKYKLDDVPPSLDEVTVEAETVSMPSKIVAVLAQVGQPIGATQIRDQLIANRAVDASAKNLLINIHTTLKRLIPDQVEEVLLEDGSKLYRFITPMERAIKAPYGAANSLANTVLKKEQPKGRLNQNRFRGRFNK